MPFLNIVKFKIWYNLEPFHAYNVFLFIRHFTFFKVFPRNGITGSKDHIFVGFSKHAARIPSERAEHTVKSRTYMLLLPCDVCCLGNFPTSSGQSMPVPSLIPAADSYPLAVGMLPHPIWNFSNQILEWLPNLSSVCLCGTVLFWFSYFSDCTFFWLTLFLSSSVSHSLSSRVFGKIHVPWLDPWPFISDSLGMDSGNLNVKEMWAFSLESVSALLSSLDFIYSWILLLICPKISISIPRLICLELWTDTVTVGMLNLDACFYICSFIQVTIFHFSSWQ